MAKLLASPFALLGALLLLASSAGLRAQSGTAGALPEARFRFRGHVVDDTRGDGVVTARGETYKLEATGRSFCVHGLFGPDAPALPLAFTLRSARLGERELELHPAPRSIRRGDRLELDHGGLVERWTVMDRSLEQSFVFTGKVLESGARLQIDVDTGLEVASDPRGLAFHAGEHGTVYYRDFVVTDAVGQRRALPIRWEGRSIVLAASESELAGLIEPLVFDPTISFVGIRLGTTRALRPDVAMDPFHRRIAVCYEELVSSSDTDVMLAHLDLAGNVVTQLAIDNRSANTVRPRIAHSLHGLMFAVVWRHAGTSGQDRIENRRINVVDMTVQPLQVLETATSGTEFSDPDIGGSISAADTRFLIAYGVHGDGIFPTNSGVLLVNLTANGIASAPRILDGDTGCTSQPQVAVSRHGGSFGQFGVVYQQKRGCLSNAFDVAFAVVNSTTTPVFGPTLVANNSGDDGEPDVAATDNRWFVVFRRLTNNDNDLIGAAYRFSNGVFTKSFGAANLSALEPDVNRTLPQLDPAIDFDGCRFTYSYREGANSMRVRTATFALSPNADAVLFSSGNESITGNDADVHGTPRLAFAASEVSRCFLTWTGGTNNTDEDVFGALLDVAADGFPPTSFVRTGCGTRGIPPSRPALGNDIALIGRPMTLFAEPSGGTKALLLGLAAPNPLPLCGGGIAPCLLGVAPILHAEMTGSLRLLVPCDPNLVGGQLAVQFIDFFVSGGCGAALFGVPLAVSDTMLVRLL